MPRRADHHTQSTNVVEAQGQPVALEGEDTCAVLAYHESDVCQLRYDEQSEIVGLCEPQDNTAQVWR